MTREAGASRTCSPRRSAWGSPRPTRRPTSTASTRRTSWHYSHARLRRGTALERIPTEGIRRIEAVDNRLCARARLHDQAARHRARRPRRDRGARAADHDPERPPAGRRGRQLQRHLRARRGARPDHVLRPGRGGAAHRDRGDRGPNRRRARPGDGRRGARAAVGRAAADAPPPPDPPLASWRASTTCA